MNIKSNLLLLPLIVLIVLGCNTTPDNKKRPNILFAISDDQSFAHTSFAGATFVKTPAFDRVANEGIYFSSCYAGSPGCAPSRSAIVTGRHHWQNEQAGQHASKWLKKYVPFTDLLSENGYAVGRSGKGVSPFFFSESENDSLVRYKGANPAGPEHSTLNYPVGSKELWTNSTKRKKYFDNFVHFIENVRGDQPFFFWYGAGEPHRAYEKDSWKRFDKKLEDVTVPGFLPDTDEIRGDLLDYAVEIEWFDLHLQMMLTYLEEIGELENTVVIVTSDNGMPFPRAKGNCYEFGAHVPLAIRYPREFPANRIISDPVGFINLAPTILEITNTSSNDMMPITGTSFLDVLKSQKSSFKDELPYAFTGRERHSSSRYKNWGYPQRTIRQGDHLLIWNMKPERWPSGAPQRIDPEDSSQLLPIHGLSAQNTYIPSSAYTDIDDSPSKSFMIENHQDDSIGYYFRLFKDKRPEFELYNVVNDPYCISNLSGKEELAALEKEMYRVLVQELEKTEDPRIVGPDKEVFDSYKRFSPMRYFPEPEN